MSVNALVFLSFSVIAPIKNAANTKPKRNPIPVLNVCRTTACRKYRHSHQSYAQIHYHANRCKLCPEQKSRHQHKNHCNVKCMVYIGSGISILINAPNCYKCRKSAHVVSSFVFNFIFERSFVLLNIHAIITSFSKKEKPSSMKLTFLCSFRCDSKH